VFATDWEQTLRNAINTISKIQSHVAVEVLMAGLLPNLHLLLSDGLDNRPDIVDGIAGLIANALERAPISGMPTPEDDHWSF
jgi:hypothetical protein